MRPPRAELWPGLPRPREHWHASCVCKVFYRTRPLRGRVRYLLEEPILKLRISCTVLLTCAVLVGCGASDTGDRTNPASMTSPNPDSNEPKPMTPPSGGEAPLPPGYTPTPVETIYTGDPEYPICNDSRVMTAGGSVTVNGVIT